MHPGSRHKVSVATDTFSTGSAGVEGWLLHKSATQRLPLPIVMGQLPRTAGPACVQGHITKCRFDPTPREQGQRALRAGHSSTSHGLRITTNRQPPTSTTSAITTSSQPLRCQGCREFAVVAFNHCRRVAYSFDHFCDKYESTACLPSSTVSGEDTMRLVQFVLPVHIPLIGKL
jgi:hypothetical protein